MTTTALTENALKLSMPDRLDLAALLLDSVPLSAGTALGGVEEAHQRVEEMASGKIKGISLEEFFRDFS